MTMALQKEMRDLLTQSYCRINELNGLVKRREMEEALEQNGLKSKLKARNIVANFHQLLDAFYKHLLKSIDSTVLEISDTLKQHSSETDEYVAYMAKLCLIAETFMKDKSAISEVNENEGMKIKEKLSESLVESEVFKTVDYNACVSLDLDFELKALFALPFIHIVSHGSGNSGIRKLYSLKFEDLRQLALDPAQSKEPDQGNSLVKEDLSASFSPSTKVTSIPGAEWQQPIAPPTVQETIFQSQTLPPSDLVMGSRPQEDFRRIPASSVNVQSMLSKTEILKDSSINEKQGKAESYLTALSFLQGKNLQKQTCPERPVRFEAKMVDGIRRGSINETVVIPCEGTSESGYYETLALLSPEKAQEWSHRE